MKVFINVLNGIKTNTFFFQIQVKDVHTSSHQSHKLFSFVFFLNLYHKGNG